MVVLGWGMATGEVQATVCSRTPAVRDAIVAAVSSKTTCSSITDTDLAGITGTLNLFNKSISSLKSGDFAGLTSVTQLILNNNSLSNLPVGIFNPLTALTDFRANSNQLQGLPSGFFDTHTGLPKLHLSGNKFSSLPDGISKLTSLEVLSFTDNQLTSLQPGVFDKLTSLTKLYLTLNSLTCLSFIPTSVTTFAVDGTASSYGACGAGVTVSKSSLSVGANSSKTYTLVLKASPNRYANSGNVTITPGSSATGKATVSPSTLTFTTGNWSTPQTVTVTGVAAGSSTVSHSISGGGYGNVSVGSVAVGVTSGTLSVSAVTAITATLTLSNHTGNWYYKYTTPTGGSCSSAVSGASTNLTGLIVATTYTFKAYSDNNCSAANVLASETFLTKPAQVSGVSLAPNNASLNVKWTAVTRATGYKVQWKSGSDDYNTTTRQQTITSGSTTSATISSLTNGTT